jgi:chaperone modulatory protein CbpM
MAGGSPHLVLDAIVVEEEITFTLTDLCRACGAERDALVELVGEGVLEPAGSMPDEWRFSGQSLRTARAALRLRQALDLGPGGAALVLDLLDEIEALRARLRRAGIA